jgi:hypothetical protein
MDGMESSDDAWFVLLRGKETEEVKGRAELSIGGESSRCEVR